jgi:hypothetical protein
MHETLFKQHQDLPYTNRTVNVGGSVLLCLKKKDKKEGKENAQYTFPHFSEVRWKIWHWFRV